MNLEEMALAYVQTIEGQANAHGQYVHPTLGASHHIMASMYKLFGQLETNAAIDAAMSKAAGLQP